MVNAQKEPMNSTTAKRKPTNTASLGKPELPRGSELEKLLEFQLKASKIGGWEREYRFDATGRRWRFDFAWPDRRVAVELQGGSWVNGGHSRGIGFENDCYKHNAAVQQGWRVLIFTGRMVKSGEAIQEIERLLGEIK